MILAHRESDGRGDRGAADGHGVFQNQRTVENRHPGACKARDRIVFVSLNRQRARAAGIGEHGSLGYEGSQRDVQCVLGNRPRLRPVDQKGRSDVRVEEETMVNPLGRTTVGLDIQSRFILVVEPDDATRENTRKPTRDGDQFLDDLVVSREGRGRGSGGEVRKTVDEETADGVARVVAQSDAGNEDRSRWIVSLQNLSQLAEPLVEVVSGEDSVGRDRHPVEVRGYVFLIEGLDPFGLPGLAIAFEQERVRQHRAHLNRRELDQVSVGRNRRSRGTGIRAPQDEPPDPARVPFRQRENVVSPGLSFFGGERHPFERQQHRYPFEGRHPFVENVERVDSPLGLDEIPGND